MSEMSNIDNATKSELLQAVEDEQIKINQNIVKLFGMELYVEKKGFTQHQIYELAGAKDYVSTITFAPDSDSAQKYGQSLTVNFIYTLKERKLLENDIYALDNDFHVKVVELLNKLNDKLSKEVKETGVNIKDIIELLVLPLNKECNTYQSKELREPYIMNIPISSSSNGGDIGWIFGFLQKMRNENIAITPDEEFEYLAYKIILDFDNVTKEEHNAIFDETNAIKSPMVAYYYLMWRKQTKGLNNKEKKHFRGNNIQSAYKTFKSNRRRIKENGAKSSKNRRKISTKIFFTI